MIGDVPIGPMSLSGFGVLWVGVVVPIWSGFLIVAAGVVTVGVLLVRNLRRAKAGGIHPSRRTLI